MTKELLCCEMNTTGSTELIQLLKLPKFEEWEIPTFCDSHYYRCIYSVLGKS